MSIVEAYLFLLADSFMGGLALSVKNDLVFTAMRIFGGYNLYIVALISTFGVTMAGVINWGLGRIMRSLKKSPAEEKTFNPLEEKTLNYISKYGYLAALFGFIPVLGSLVTVALGTLPGSFRKVVALVFLANLLWRVFLIYSF